MMNRRVWTGTCAAIIGVATAGILAQTPTPTATPQQSAPSNSDTKIVVTGCLTAAPAIPSDTASAANPNPTGTAGTTTAGATATTGTAPDVKFILTSAAAAPADSSSSAGAVGTAQTYRLIANPTALADHVGKKLELTGTIDPASTADPKDPSAMAPALRVLSGKIVAASCSE
jgi:hypothetical protein